MKKVIIPLFAGLIIGLVIFFGNKAQKSTNTVADQETELEQNSENKKESKLVSERQTTYEKMGTAQYKDKELELERDLNQRKKECEVKTTLFFSNENKFETINEKKPTVIISELRDLFKETLHRPAQIKLYRYFEQMAKEEKSPFTAEEIFQKMKDNRICRDGRALSYINSSIDTIKKGGWKEEEKLELVGLTLYSLGEVLSNEYTSENMAMIIGKFSSLMEAKLLKRTNMDELNELRSKVLEEHELFKNNYESNKTPEKRMEALNSHFQVTKELGDQLQSYLSRELEEVEAKLQRKL